jgi:hypothetical protein
MTWAQTIKAEYAALKEDEDLLHNKVLHKRILSTWAQESPKFLGALQKDQMAEELAFVVQERMWQTEEALRKGGMAYPDSLEQAEREELMLEPEAQRPLE